LDLLNKRNKVKLRVDTHNRVHARGAKVKTASTAAELIQIFKQGNSLRKMEATERNPDSSRSHSIVRIKLLSDQKWEDRKKRNVPSINLVDLAGSERNYETWFHTSEQHKKFVGINQSLMALRGLFRAYRKQIDTNTLPDITEVKSEGSFIPFHASSLTHVLRECFLDPSHKTVVVATISPTATDIEHTRDTLESVTFMMGKRRRDEKLFDVEVEDVKEAILKVHAMHMWTSSQMEEFFKLNLTHDEFSKLNLENTTSKKITRMGPAQVTHMICGGNKYIGKKVYELIRRKLIEFREKNARIRAERARKDIVKRKSPVSRHTCPVTDCKCSFNFATALQAHMRRAHGINNTATANRRRNRNTTSEFHGYRGGGVDWLKGNGYLDEEKDDDDDKKEY